MLESQRQMLTERSRSSSRLKIRRNEQATEEKTQVRDGDDGEKEPNTALREISDLKNEIAKLTESLNCFASFTQSTM